MPQAGQHVSRIGFEAWAEPLGRKLLGNRNRAGRGVERFERRLGGISLELSFAQPGKRRLGFRERAFENRSRLDTTAPRDPDRLRRPGDPPSAFEL